MEIGLPDVEVHRVMAQTELREVTDYGLELIGIPTLWKDTNGAGIKIGLADSGVQADHPDLRHAVAGERNFSSSGVTTDRHGHGTHCAGVMVAQHNGIGIRGIAPQAKLYSAKVLNERGIGSGQQVARGLDWLAENGCQIVNLSLGSPVADDFIGAAIIRLTRAGIVVVCAAGNSGKPDDVHYPARYNGHLDRYLDTISVGAVGPDRLPAPFTSRGQDVDIAAPGVEVLSTYPGGQYARMSGTSMASPHVSGFLALQLARRIKSGLPVWQSTQELRDELRRNAQDLDAPGHDHATGWGLVSPGPWGLPHEDPPANEIPDEITTVPATGGVLVFIPDHQVVRVVKPDEVAEIGRQRGGGCQVTT